MIYPLVEANLLGICGIANVGLKVNVFEWEMYATVLYIYFRYYSP
jgi:hypothetical protein